jgi:hypothetical protein
MKVEELFEVFQVDGVEISKKYQRDGDGIGYYLYLALINAGYGVFSNN